MAEVADSRVKGRGTACAHALRALPAVAAVATGHHDVVSHRIAAYDTLLSSSACGMGTATAAGVAKGSPSVPLAPAEPLKMSIEMKNEGI